MQELVRFYQGKSFSPRLLQTKEQVSEFFFSTDAKNPSIDTILFDCDGVLYRSPDAVPGARECIQRLLRASNTNTQQPQVLFVTNNAGTNRQQLVDKLTNLLHLSENDVLKPEMMVSSSYSCAQYIRTKLEKTSGSPRLFVIGSIGLCEELRVETGVQDIWRIDDDEPHSMSREEMVLVSSESDEESNSSLKVVDAVVVGHDTAFTFRKLTIATNLLRCSPHAPLIATNLDAFDLVGTNGYHIPGNGALVRSVRHEK
jgi:HAD superfamily hydrolase (TIGR01450 family)